MQRTVAHSLHEASPVEGGARARPRLVRHARRRSHLTTRTRKRTLTRKRTRTSTTPTSLTSDESHIVKRDRHGTARLPPMSGPSRLQREQLRGSERAVVREREGRRGSTKAADATGVRA